MSRYQYTALESAKRELRVVHLLPGSMNEDLGICIVHVPFSTAKPPRYEALSYTWGSEENPHTLHVRRPASSNNLLSRLWQKGDRTEARNGTIALRGRPPQLQDTLKLETLSITQNLAFALRYLRQEEHIRVLWIDAICIDQQNLQERSTEVKRMGDIYRSASQVIVWLGPASLSSDLAMESISLLSQQLQDLGPGSNIVYTSSANLRTSPGLTRDTREELRARKAAVSALLHQPWFTRLWIWQELILPTQVIVLCGRSKIHYSQFRKAIMMMFGHLPGGDVMHDFLDQKIGDAIYRLMSMPRESPPFNVLIDHTKYAMCKDPRDRIYGVLRLASPEMKAEIDPDYTMTIEEVYRNACLSCIKVYQSLDILTFCEMSYPPAWNRSWTPCFATPKLTKSISYGNASGSSKPEIRITEDYKMLADGVHIALVSRVSTPVPHNTSVKRLLEIVRGWAFEYLHENSRQVTAEELKAFVETLQNQQYIVETIDECKLLGHSVSRYETNSFRDFMFTDLDRTSEEELLGIPFVQSVLLTIPGRAMFKTAEGFYGLGPAAMEFGDHICVFLGGGTPMVLRPSWQQLNYHKIVGACFVHKYMDKEALLGPLPLPSEPITPYPLRWISILNGQMRMMYLQDSIATEEDPRLGPLPPGWQILERTISSSFEQDFPNHRKFLKRPNDDLRIGDPRLTSKALRARGVKIKTFTLI